jgi:hypothetical protein
MPLRHRSPAGQLACAAILAVCACGCSRESAPRAIAVQEPVELCPGYADLTIPPNIAPLVCEIGNEGRAFRHTLSSCDGKLTHRGEGRTICPPLHLWRRMLDSSKGQHITLEVLAERGDGWVRLVTVTNRVAMEPIDTALVYRLIPPSYEHFTKLSLCQRDLTSFEERTLYSNMQVSREQCINCHTFRNHDGRFFAFHARQSNGGTVIFKGEAPGRKIDLKCGNLYSSGVYPAWHPTRENLFAFSVNKTAQLFYLTYNGKIEVLDSRSGLVLYDLDKNEVTPIQLDENVLATYPEWSPDGNTLYYTAAQMEQLTAGAGETQRLTEVCGQLTNMCYHLVCRSFDPQTRIFGDPRLLINAAESHASIAFPRVSPDGVHLMMTVASYADFPVWHKESDLWLYNTVTREARAMTEVNGTDADSYHTWGSNGRWFVFGSRRDDGVHTRPYLAYFDPATGKAGKPFLVPQKNPRLYREFYFSFNRPELLKTPVPYSPDEVRRAMLKPAEKATFNAGRSP